ncbi:Rho GTPase-activating protein 1 [Rhynchospora pubera]|uniref:Rho GTPase-activating protein 1 n=2 Tax=Rhynchospora pubera TaxID=906938 RepID=A0AAV8C7A6_9POAL|nr:Rho GTPase-activating protein 1 [Rhynchospora pubera]KAJ4819448.1 Rho GTPase-activating protein 1 [Rhynchospora pubera]
MAEVALRSPSLSNDGAVSATHLSSDEDRRKRTNPTRRSLALQVQEAHSAEQDWSFWALLFDLVRRSVFGCKTEGGGGDDGHRSMEIGWPTDVQHVAHVTFDRFHGFLGLPVEFEPEVPRRAPSASANVFGVSTESMQCSYDSRGNSIPTILLLMQRRLYEQAGLRAEGIFRINAENSQEEFVRDQLNRGIVPDGIDVHCLAGLIKAWFRELPRGVLDSIPPELVMQCQTEDDCKRVAKCLPPTEAALLDWAINLMADVVQEEQINKMSARNIAMVFAPNMTQMADPLTALMYAVQVMNFLKMLILKTLKDRQEQNIDPISLPSADPADQNGDQTNQVPHNVSIADNEEPNHDQPFLSEDPSLSESSPRHPEPEEKENIEMADSQIAAHGNDLSGVPLQTEGSTSGATNAINVNLNSLRKSKTPRSPSHKRSRKGKGQSVVRSLVSGEKSKGTSIVSRINSKNERIEAWR